MDFLSKYLEQFRDLFASMTPGARLTTGALLAVVAVSVAMLFKQSTSGPDAFLYGGEPLTRQEIINVTGALAQQGLKDYEIVGNMVRVPRLKRDEYAAAIASAGAQPRSANGVLTEALDGLSPMSSNVVQRQQYKAARELELSMIISKMAWVEDASVLYDEKEIRGLRHSTLSSATVNVMPMAGEALDTKRVRNLQNLVAGAFASMKPEHVVINNLGLDDGAAYTQVSADDFKTPYLQEQVRLEDATKLKVEQRLGYIPGLKVQVKVELDEKLSEESIATRPDGTPVTVHESEMTETTKSSNTDGGASPGLFAQGPGRPRDAAPAKKNTAESTRSQTESTTKPYEIKVATVTSGLVPKSMWASIGVPREWVVKLWKQKKLETEGAEPDLVDDQEVRLLEDKIKKDIQTAVEPLMTELSAGKDDFSQVKVVVYDALPKAEIEKPSIASQGLYWLSQYGNSLAMLGLAGFSLIMLRSMVRSGSSDLPAGPPALQLNTEPDAAPDDAAPGEETREKLRLKKPDPVKDDLADMVREDPDAAAAILSNWISNAS